MTKAKSTDKTEIIVTNPIGKDDVGIIFAIIGFTCILLWFIWGVKGAGYFSSFWHPGEADDSTLTQLGQAGDMFGGLSSLFAALAFVAVALGAVYQHKTYLLQVDDSRRTQIALDRSNETNATQLKLLHQQLFEDRFFRLIAESQNVLDKLVIAPKGDPKTTKLHTGSLDEFFADLRDKMKHRIWPDDNEASLINYLKFRIGRFYGAIYEDHSPKLAPLFRFLYHTFALLDTSGLSYSEQSRYAKIARAALNDDHLRLLMMNGVCEWGQNFKPLIEKYGLLKHLSDQDVDDAFLVSHKLYEQPAFSGYGYRRCWFDDKGHIRKDEIQLTMVAEYNDQLEGVKVLGPHAMIADLFK